MLLDILFLCCVLFLHSFNALSPLTSLLNLKHLTLQIDIHHPSTPPLRLTNPVCHDPNYTIVMCESFSSLLWLDGEAFEGVPGSKFFKEVRDVKEQGSKSGGGGLRMGKPHDSSEFYLYFYIVIN